MELRHLRAFVVVAETLNITAAARRLRLSQPTLSRHIHDLEHVVGHPLFVRQPDGLRLTATGATLRDHGVRALTIADEAIQSTRGAAAKAGTVLRVGYYGSVSIWAGILAPALEKLTRKFPNVTSNVVEQTCGQLVTELREGRLDAAVLGPGEYARIPGVVIEVACTVPAMVMLPINHRLAKKRMIALEDLRTELVIGVTPESAPGRDHAFIAACRAAGFTPNMVNTAAGLPDAIATVKQRMGVGILGAFAMMAPHPGVVFTRLKPAVPLAIYAAHAQASAMARQLAALIVAEARRAALET